MIGKINNLIDELPQASNRRVEEIATILEDVLSDIECKYPIEDDSDSAYECQYIPKARELVVLVRAWNGSDGDRDRKNRECGIIHGLSKELHTTFNQI